VAGWSPVPGDGDPDRRLREYDIPDEVGTDNGRQFTARVHAMVAE
jgi:hypothetical protein